MGTHLLTGAGSGIGAALAAVLHGRGEDLVLLARSPERAEELAARWAGATTVVADLADADADAVEGLDLPARLDSVVHAAGIVDLGPVAELSSRQWRETLEVNLVAPAALTRRALPALRAARGTVVLVNSGSGLRANPDWSSYAASKFGLRAFADALRGEEREHGVRVSTVYPGRTADPDAAAGARARGPRLRRGASGSGPRRWRLRSCTCSTCRATPRCRT